MEFGLPFGTLVCCLSLVGIMFDLWVAGVYWFIIGIIIIVDRFHEWNKEKHKVIDGVD